MSIITSKLRKLFTNRNYVNGCKYMSDLELPELCILKSTDPSRILMEKFGSPTSPALDAAVLAGEPKCLPDHSQEFWVDVIHKWNEKTQRDIYKESAKHSLIY